MYIKKKSSISCSHRHTSPPASLRTQWAASDPRVGFFPLIT